MIYQQLKSAFYVQIFLKYILVVLLWAFSSYDAQAQQQMLTKHQKTDSALVRAVKIYDNEIGRNSFLYTGRVYNDNFGSIKGHQYFGEDYWEQCEIVYEGQHFDSVYLMYDIYNDLLLLEHFNSNGLLSPITLYNPKISSFSVQGYSFVHLEKDTISGKPNGFYNELFVGEHIQLYALRRKEIVKSNEINTVHEEFAQKDRYYLKYQDVFYPIRNKRKIYKIMADHKRDIKHFIKSNMLFYRQNPEKYMVEVTKYYNSLF